MQSIHWISYLMLCSVNHQIYIYIYTVFDLISEVRFFSMLMIFDIIIYRKQSNKKYEIFLHTVFDLISEVRLTNFFAKKK